MQTDVSCEEYRVGWLSVIQNEILAALQFFDKELEQPPPVLGDSNIYKCGIMGGHLVVMTWLGESEQGTDPAARASTHMKRSFPNLEICLLVGVGGGVPRPEEEDIRLGDVVVGTPTKERSAIWQYDFGKMKENVGLVPHRYLRQPPTKMLVGIQALKLEHHPRGNNIHETVEQKLKGMHQNHEFLRPPPETDRLYKTGFAHSDETKSCAQVCHDDNLVQRLPRDEGNPRTEVHYGEIASGNTVIKDARLRDQYAYGEHKILCFEMEAAGVVNDFECVVIRGICDYADSHKNKNWQGYASMTAACCARQLLDVMPPAQANTLRHDLAGVSDRKRAWAGEDSITESSRKTPAPFLRSRNKLDMTPVKPNEFFHGREETLGQLRNFVHPDVCEPFERTPCVLLGLGGAGKTQIAAKYVETHKHEYSYIFWVTAEEPTQIAETFGEIAERLELSRSKNQRQRIEAVRKWLSTTGINSSSTMIGGALIQWQTRAG